MRSNPFNAQWFATASPAKLALASFAIATTGISLFGFTALKLFAICHNTRIRDLPTVFVISNKDAPTGFVLEE